MCETVTGPTFAFASFPQLCTALTRMNTNPQTGGDPEDEKQCRICFDGPDPQSESLLDLVLSAPHIHQSMQWAG